MKLLIEIPAWLGDAVMATPAIENIANYYNKPEIILIGSFVSVETLKNNPKVAETYILEKKWQNSLLLRRTVLYEKIDNIKPENHEQLLNDLNDRTGLNIQRFEIRRVNFLRDTADILIYYEDEGNHIDHFRKPKSGSPSGG